MSKYLENSKQYKGFHYSILGKDELVYLHETTLKMLKVIIPIMERNNIRYFICGGTLLGAVTTGSFIPWDDDVDICILEDDYDKAIEIVRQEIPSWIFVQCKSTEDKYFHGWVKIRDRNSHVYPDISSYKENGVWIDLYKLTIAPKSNVPYLIAKEHLDYLDRRYKVGDISDAERSKRINANCLIERINKQRVIMENSQDSEETFIIWSASKILVDKKWVFPRVRYPFEGMELFGFNDAKQYLERHYGESYMKLPPMEMRRIGINKIEVLNN